MDAVNSIARLATKLLLDLNLLLTAFELVVNANWTRTLPNYDVLLQDLPKQYLCSGCHLSLLEALQSTPYSNYDESFVEQYQAVQRGEKSYSPP